MALAPARAGDLKERVGFYSPQSSDDGYGNVQSGYGTTADFVVAAAIEPKLGGEGVLAGRLTGTNVVNISIRQSAVTIVINADWKARDERVGVDYNIRSVIDPNRGTPRQGAFLEMLCERGAAV